ncbi:MAG: phosphoserine phosphatase SerB [Pseudomonadota bacterium]
MSQPHVLTLIAAPGTALSLDYLVSPLTSSGVAFASITWLAPTIACDLVLNVAPPPHSYAETLARCAQTQVDSALQPLAQRRKTLLISDMDSTMIEQECIDELADVMGLKPRVSAITERAMNGELDFKEALRERVALLATMPEAALQDVFDRRITLMPGAKTLVATMKAGGATAHLVSGGFTFFTARVARALGFDGHEANILQAADGKLTGTVAEPILDKDSKRASLERLMEEKAIPREATLAVGDGANDLPMILAAGLGVAYHAKPVVEAQAPVSIRHHNLTALLYLQGIPRDEWVE